MACRASGGFLKFFLSTEHTPSGFTFLAPIDHAQAIQDDLKGLMAFFFCLTRSCQVLFILMPNQIVDALPRLPRRVQ